MEKSAKDIAFDKERAKYRQAVRLVQSDNKKKDEKIQLLEERVRILESKNYEQTEYIERLLTYTEMDHKDMIALIQKEKETAKAMEHASMLFSFGSSFRM